MSLLMTLYLLLLTTARAETATCQFFVDDQPYRDAPTCDAFSAIKVVCPATSAVKSGGFDLLEYKVWLGHLDVSALKAISGTKAASFLDKKGNMVFWIVNPEDQQGDFSFGDQRVAMRDLCEVPRKYKVISLEVEVIAKGFHQTGTREESEWDDHREVWIKREYPIFDDGTRVAEGKMAITQLPPLANVTDEAGVLEVGLLDPENMSAKPLPDHYATVSHPGVEVTAKVGEKAFDITIHYLSDEYANKVFANEMPAGMSPYDFMQQDIQRHLQPDFELDDFGRSLVEWWYVWRRGNLSYAFRDERDLQRLSSTGLINQKKAATLFASLPTLPEDKVEKTKIKAEKAQAKVDVERNRMGVQHTGWVEEKHGDLTFQHWKLEQLDGSYPTLTRWADVESAFVEPLNLHVFMARAGSCTIIAWTVLNKSILEQGPEAVAEAERQIAATMDRVQLHL